MARPRMANLVPARGEQNGFTREDLVSGISSEDVLGFLTENLTILLAQVLHMAPGQLDHNRRLDDYGMDSLMAAELLIALQQLYEVGIPPMELLRAQQRHDRGHRPARPYAPRPSRRGARPGQGCPFRPEPGQ
ncbi:acyl carrier protein [Streptomyces sp. H27-D2]|uniref:acyl carrier protein n=1 Tax=Streptomyces sp. H27-D2 TaxID=3046304 RepID=UPI002DBC293A|nr:acyl carrier protein [Streptomyces sp. H27-D2]MEC4015379.1 acyl carrier protein [Streptomyces sp. H27-D2]